MKKVLPFIFIFLVLVNIFAPFGVGLDKNNTVVIKKSVAEASGVKLDGNVYVTNKSIRVVVKATWTDISWKTQEKVGVILKDATDKFLNGKFVEFNKANITNIDGSTTQIGDDVLFDTGILPDTVYKISILAQQIGSNLSGTPEVGQLVINKTVRTNLANIETEIDQGQFAGVNGDAVIPGCGFGFSDTSSITGCAGQLLYYVLFQPTSYIFELAGKFFDFTFSYSVRDTSYRSPFVVQGWGIIRDFCNVFFIFVLLYVAFATILSLHGFKTKETIVNVVVIGLLINFSLFASQVMIDASNILARVFYTPKIVVTGDKGPNGSVTSDLGANDEIQLSAALVDKVDPQNLIIKSAQINDVDNGRTAVQGIPTLSAGHFILVTILAIAVNIVGIIVFLSVGLIFITRVIGLWLAMIFVPLAFFSYMVPPMKDMSMVGWKHWWPETLKLAFLAPVFIFFLYLILQFLDTGLDLIHAKGETGVAFVVATIVPFLFIMILLMKAKDIAKDMSGKLGQSITGAIGKATMVAGGIGVGAIAGLGATALRGTVGRAGSAFANSAFMKKMEARGVIGARALRNLGKAAGTGSMDIRGLKVAGKGLSDTGLKGLGKAKEGGFAKMRADKLAARQKRAEELKVGEDEKLKQDLNTAEVQLQQILRENSHDLETQDKKIASVKDKLSTAQALAKSATTPQEKRERQGKANILAKELARLQQEKKDRKDAIGIHKTNTHNGNISEAAVNQALEKLKIAQKAQREGTDAIKAADNEANDSAMKVAELEAIVAAEQAAFDQDPALGNAGVLQAAKDALAAEQANYQNVLSVGTENRLKVSQSIAELQAEWDKISKEAKEAKKNGGYGKSINDYEDKILPDLHHKVEKENNDRMWDYAAHVSGNLNKSLNWLSSGGQHSSNGANEAAHKIRMGAKVDSGGKEH